MATNALSKADLIPDGVVGAARDDLDHDAIASVVSNLACAVDTPSNIALFGPWGSGKSSLYQMVRDRIPASDPQVAVVKYDAWKFGGVMLQRNFLFEIASQLDIPRDKFLSNLDSSTETTRLRLGRFILRNKGSILLALGIALVVAVTYVAGMAGVEQIGKTTWRSEARALIPTGAAVFGLVMAGLLLSNQTLSSATEKRSRSPLQDADQFSGAFDKLMEKVREKRVKGRRVTRLVVFIDELDRCKPEDVVSVLISLKTFLDHTNCVFIVAADRDVLREALEEAPQAKPVREDEPYYSTAGAFIDKIFQHQVSLPPVRAEALIDYAMTLANTQRGLWKTLREHDKRSYEDVVYSLVPAHVQSPRRVKVLMNNFVTTYRVIQARQLNRLPEPSEVAVLTVLQTEFPSLVQDLVHEPRLIEALIDPSLAKDEDASDRLRELVETYNPDKVDEQDRSPAGPLLTDETPGDDTRQRSARLKLNQQLDAYLAYIHGAGIPFPTLDLIYLQDAASVQGLEHPGLRQLLDVAHVYAPDTIAHEFSSASTTDRMAAIRFLATKANTTFGPARANLIEVACRIAATLDLPNIQAIAPTVTPTVLGEARGQRWRTNATPGALLLGLLDPQQANPIEQLGEHAAPEVLVKHEVFDIITPTLEHITDERAFPVHRVLAQSYPKHPDPLHAALRDLPSKVADRLWRDVEQPIANVLDQLPSEHEAPVVAPRRVNAPAPEPEEPQPLAQERYEELLTAMSERSTAASVSVAGALMLGLRDDEHPLMYAQSRTYSDDLLGTAVNDPTQRNRVALTAIAIAPADDIAYWSEFLTTQGASDEQALGGATGRIISDLRKGTPVQTATLAPIYAKLAGWLTDDAVAEHVTTITATLDETPFGNAPDPAGQRRLTAYRLLEVLGPRIGQDEIHRIRREDIEHFLETGEPLATALDELLTHVDLLSAEQADALEAVLTQQQKASNEPLALTRLRIRARARAAKKPLAASTFAKHLIGDTSSAAVLNEWMRTSPPLKDVQGIVKKAALGQTPLSDYAEQRSTADRSRLWITLHESTYDDGHLAAVGRHGVNATPVEHLRAAILDADLNEQKPLVARLLTADLSQDSGARKAASALAIDLLNSGRVGSGRSAATIVLKAGGAGTGMTNPLRQAFDKFTTKNPRVLNRGDVRRLNDMNLLTKKKSNPVSKFLDWFVEDAD